MTREDERTRPTDPPPRPRVPRPQPPARHDDDDEPPTVLESEPPQTSASRPSAWARRIPQQPNVPIFSMPPGAVPQGASIVPISVPPPPPRLMQQAAVALPGVVAMGIVGWLAHGHTISGDLAVGAVLAVVSGYLNPPGNRGQMQQGILTIPGVFPPKG